MSVTRRDTFRTDCKRAGERCTLTSPMAASTTASQEELKAAKVPLAWRDRCSA